MPSDRVRVKNLTPVKQESGPWWIPANGTATIPVDILTSFGNAVAIIETPVETPSIAMYRDICRDGCGHSLCILTRKCSAALKRLGVSVDRQPWRRDFDQRPLDGREGERTTPFANAGTWEGPAGRWSWIHYDNDRAPENHVEWWDAHFEGNICVSQSVVDGMIRSGAPEHKLRLVPNAIDTELFRPDAPVFEPEGVGDRFMFLMTGALSVRKGTDLAFEAYGQTFNASDPVVLYVRNYDYGRAGETASFLEDWRKRRGPGAPLVISVYETWSEEQMVGAYRRAAEHGAFFAPHRVEGFGLCGLEALACGCRLGTTGWSGPLEYATKENSTLFSYAMRPSEFNLGLYRADEKPEWAEPKIKSIRTWLRRMVDEKPDRDKQRAIAADVRSRFTFDRMARGIADAVGIQVVSGEARKGVLPGTSPAALPRRVATKVAGVETLAVSIATRDRQEYLAAVLGALLAQTKRPDEIAIVDESEVQISESPALSHIVQHMQSEGIVVYHLPGTGRGASPNHQRALEAMNCDLIMRLDEDLLPVCPDFLERLYLLINGHADIGAVAGCYPRAREKTERIYAQASGQPGMTNSIQEMFGGHVGLQFSRWADEATVECEHLYSSYMYRRQAMLAVGGFAQCYSRFGQREETDAVVRLRMLGKLRLLVDTRALAVHFEANGGRRPEMNGQNWTHDERLFHERYQEWVKEAGRA